MADMEQQAEYLQAHGLDKVLEALVVETMQHQPEDPFDYMSQQMFKMAESFSQLTAHAAASAGGAAPAAKEDGWWTKWKGPDVALSLEEKVKRSAGVAEEIIKFAKSRVWEKEKQPQTAQQPVRDMPLSFCGRDRPDLCLFVRHLRFGDIEQRNTI